MSADGKLGPKKLRRAEHLAGEPLAMAFAWSPSCWEVVTPYDRHLYVNPRTGSVETVTGAELAHWTTCPSRAPA